MQSWKVLASSWWWEEQGDYSDEVMGKGRMGQEPGEHETLKVICYLESIGKNTGQVRSLL